MSNDDKDTLAGEYVLGLLGEAEAAAVARDAETDSELARAIAFWQGRLDPLADALPPVPPTRQLWARISADMEPVSARQAAASARPPARPAWRGTAIASLLLAACLAAFIGWSRLVAPVPSPAFKAEALLAPPGSFVASVRVQVVASGEMVMVPLQKLVVAEGRQMDLWAWPREEKAPVLLGSVRADGGARPFPYPPREGTPVMITDEKSGSGLPAAPGPTLYAGLLTISR
jgi:anti-sigma-K factor RskA